MNVYNEGMIVLLLLLLLLLLLILSSLHKYGDKVSRVLERETVCIMADHNCYVLL